MNLPECPYNGGVECIEADRISNECLRCAWNTDYPIGEIRLRKIKSRLQDGTPETAIREMATRMTNI